MSEELGDLLLQIVFHSELARESGEFAISEVIEKLLSKLFHRHPHVFGDVVAEGATDVLRNWESLKSREKNREDPTDDIPRALPALLVAYKVQRRMGEIASEGERLEEEEVGRRLFEIVAIASRSSVDPEGALRRYVRTLAKSRP